jgi:GalNAc5-diNAcBac-PP-undecaprenol beta-1,3-glucosyltransferase
MRVFFSVIVPIYNRRHLIKPVIDSVLKQSYTDFELLLVDDGSTDNAGEFISGQYSDQRIKYFYKKNEERAAARNFGLDKASGNYGVFLDSDDLMESNYLSTLVDIIKSHPDQGMIATKYNFIFPNGDQAPSPMQPLKESFYDFNFFLKGNVLGCNICLKLFEFNYKRFPPERELAAMEDWLFLLLNTRLQPIFIKDIVCVHMQQHEGRSMAQNQVVIKARKNATEWVLKNMSLSNLETKKLKTWSHYFCGVHEYLDGNKKKSIGESVQVLRLGGLKGKFVLLFIKAIIGSKLIRRNK